MPPKGNKIEIISEYRDLASEKIKTAFKKQERSVKGFSAEFEKMRKSMNRSMNRTRKDTVAALKGIDQGLKKTAQESKRTRTEMGKMRLITQGMQLWFGRIRNILLLYGFATRLVLRPIMALTKAFMRQQDAVIRLNNMLRIQGTLLPVVSKQLQDMAKAFQETTRFGDEMILEVMQRLVVIGKILPSQMKPAIQAVLDFAAATGRDLAASSQILAKAAAGYTGELSRYGIIIDSAIPKTKRFAAVLKFINERMGGAAQADVKSYSGQIAQLKNVYSDLLENLGLIVFKLVNFSKHLAFARDVIKAMREETQRIGERSRIQVLDQEIRKLTKTLKIQEEALARQKKPLQGIDFMYISISKGVARTNSKIAELIALRDKEIKQAQNQLFIERDLQLMLEKRVTTQVEADKIISQHAKAMQSATESWARQGAKSFEDLFFNVVHGRIRELEDVFVAFGQSMLKVLIELGVKMAFVKIGLGSILGLSPVGGHSGLYIRHGMESSSGSGPRQGGTRQKFHAGGEVPATLLAGEGVVNKRGMANLGIQNLDRLNRGEGGGGGNTYITNNIQTIDERSFRERLAQNPDIFSDAAVNDIKDNGATRKIIQRFA